ncbi:hypothetical protein TorRG33x02_263730 [Trema orientale]|uniref:Uncharacterized protein n=1 Tax=Trema orientale TaxID=63057 RepID=A0A2P5D3C9_TREOI|nr:hypothetical protein TorRG33x02_263730 [Trema orientale]
MMAYIDTAIDLQPISRSVFDSQSPNQAQNQRMEHRNKKIEEKLLRETKRNGGDGEIEDIRSSRACRCCSLLHCLLWHSLSFFPFFLPKTKPKQVYYIPQQISYIYYYENFIYQK